MAQHWLLIRHEDGREYQVQPRTYHAQYEALGFVVVSYADGAPYTPPQRKAATKPTPKPTEAGTDEG